MPRKISARKANKEISINAKRQVTEDDFNMQKKCNVQPPQVRVDYLSYKFNEMDLAASWREVTNQKKVMADGIRLENASWRTWAKQRNNLQTIDPLSLNWQKVNDVTWLYGPLHTVIKTEFDPFENSKIATAEEKLGLIIDHQEPVLKSALKKLTAIDRLKRSTVDLSLCSLFDGNRRTKSQSKHCQSTLDSDEKSGSTSVRTKPSKLRFNKLVEQCVAIDSPVLKEQFLFNENGTSKTSLDYAFIKRIESTELKSVMHDLESDDVLFL